MYLVDKMRRYSDLLQFFVTQHVIGFDVPSEPYFDEQATPTFITLLQNCRFFLEYGSGGSTVTAARLNKAFISVDTDKYFQKSVARKIGTLKANQHLIYADIGLTGPWGRPLLIRHLSEQRQKKWLNYPNLPWHNMGNQLPDLVLIDGRFRVTTTLTCCTHLAHHPEARIIVDDYSDRPHYHVIEKHAKLIAMYGRMAVFQPIEYSPELRKIITEYALDWR